MTKGRYSIDGVLITYKFHLTFTSLIWKPKDKPLLILLVLADIIIKGRNCLAIHSSTIKKVFGEVFYLRNNSFSFSRPVVDVPDNL